MKQSVIAAVALMGASTLASSIGKAVVVNACSYDVHLCNVPAAGGGYVEQDKLLSPGDEWSQTWTSLSNGNGWSIKLSKSSILDNIMQYEYTWHNDGIIWYDLSDVNGNPWDGNWEITADGENCTPKQQAYRFSTDDAYGMQSCPGDSTITVTLCSGENQTNATVSSILSSVEAAVPTISVPEVQTPSSTYVAPVASTTAAAHHTYGGRPGQNNKAEVDSATTPTTFATSTTTAAVEVAPGFTVYEVETAVFTEIVTAYYTPPARAKRHEHHAGHHQHNA